MLKMIHKDQSTHPRGKAQENVCILSELKHSTGRLQPPKKTHHSAQQLFLTSGFLPVRTSPLLHLLVHSQGLQQPSPSSVSASLQNTFLLTFLSCPLCPYFILFPDFSTARQIYLRITMIIPRKRLPEKMQMPHDIKRVSF